MKSNYTLTGFRNAVEEITVKFNDKYNKLQQVRAEVEIGVSALIIHLKIQDNNNKDIFNKRILYHVQKTNINKNVVRFRTLIGQGLTLEEVVIGSNFMILLQDYIDYINRKE